MHPHHTAPHTHTPRPPQVNADLKTHLADLYETDAIFDKFECAVSGDGQHLATGTYNNAFQVCACMCVVLVMVGMDGWKSVNDPPTHPTL